MSDHDVRGPEERFTPFTREETKQVREYLEDKYGVSDTRPTSQLAADARRRFDRVEILHRLRAVEEGGTTSYERDLVARVTDLEALEAQTARQRDGYAERAIAAEAQVAALTQERDDWETTARAESDGLMRWHDRARAAEAALAEVRGKWQIDVSAWAVERGRLTRALAATRQALRLWAGYYESVKHDPDYDMDGIEWDDIYEQTRALAAIEDSP